MTAEEAKTVHRPGLFKLPNKKHRTGRHRSKHEIARDNNGRVAGVQKTQFKKSRKLNKAQRKNQSRQMSAQKREHLLELLQMVKGVGECRAPILSTVLIFDDKLNFEKLMQRLVDADSESTCERSEWSGCYVLDVPRFKARYSFLSPNPANIMDLLDCVRISELLVVVWPAEEPITEDQRQLFSILLAQGQPVMLHLTVGLPQNGKHRDKMRKTLERSMANWPSLADEKVHNFDSDSEALKILRAISSMQKKPIILQQRHPHLLAEQLCVEETAENADEVGDAAEKLCRLKISGFLRGTPLSADQLVHIQGWGDFPMSRVDIHKKIPRHPKNATAVDGSENVEVLMRTTSFTGIAALVNPGQNSGDVGGESSDEEMGSDDEDDDDDEDFSGGVSESDSEDDDSEAGLTKNDDEDEIMSMADNSSYSLRTINMSEVKKYREERENAQWPDETETPQNIPAREAFMKYRGLKSFRTSFWDPKENLPRDYSCIYKFSDFKRTKKIVLAEIQRAFRESDVFARNAVGKKKKKSKKQKSVTASTVTDVEMNDGEESVIQGETTATRYAFPGQYVTLYVENVPLTIREELLPDKALIVFGLMTHEEKISVMNLVLEKQPSCQVPIQTHDALVFQVGYRRFEAAALFSQHNNGNKFKMERFMPTEGTFCASVFAPVAFPPTTALVFRRDAKNRIKIVATGKVLDMDPDRIVLKRIVLSGHPFKVNQRMAVVRYMFFNKEDVEWFKPVEVYTSKGRHGHIKESLGTHGFMKCLFDQPLSTQDSVFMNLYKRVYPRLTYNARVVAGSTQNSIMLTSSRSEVNSEMNDEVMSTL